MKCPLCGAKTRVTRTLSDSAPVQRKRKCSGCKQNFTTAESIVILTPLRVAKAGNRKPEPFNRRKILKTLGWLANTHELSQQDREEIVQGIEVQLVSMMFQEVIPTDSIAELLFLELRLRNDAAARRFASRYERDGKGDPIFRRETDIFEREEFEDDDQRQLNLFSDETQEQSDV